MHEMNKRMGVDTLGSSNDDDDERKGKLGSREVLFRQSPLSAASGSLLPHTRKQNSTFMISSPSITFPEDVNPINAIVKSKSPNISKLLALQKIGSEAVTKAHANIQARIANKKEILHTSVHSCLQHPKRNQPPLPSQTSPQVKQIPSKFYYILL